LGRKEIIMIKQYFKIAVKNLRTRPLRSWLTILGIVIGVFLITSLLSLSEGLKNTIMKQLKMIGSDIIIIFPGETTDFMTAFLGHLRLTEDDLKAIKKTEGVKSVLPIIHKTIIVRHEGSSKALLVSGSDWRNSLDIYTGDLGLSLTEGEWPIPGKREVVVGSLVPEDIFEGVEVGDSLSIKGRSYEIVGVLKSMGQKTDDSLVHIDIDIFREITGERRGAAQALAKVAPGYSAEEVAEKIKETLLDIGKRKKGEELMPFSVLSSEKATSLISDVMGVVQLAVFSFASIAVVVGGIGIMNTMYTAVHERKKEIGILKAVGARNSAITLIFLIESGIIGLVGGLGGILPGLLLAKSIEYFGQVHPVFYLEASISPFIVFFGLSFSFLIGCLSGFFPAKSVSKLNPVDALRGYE